jgi:DNA-binding NarL/FixJ family response regulator
MKNHKQALSILLIDANQLDANLVQRLIIRISQGLWTSTHVSSLEDGVQVYQAYQDVHPERQSFDGVILTLSLPDLKGVDVVRKFSQIYPNAIIIVLTESSNKPLRQEVLAMGISQFLIKEEISINQLESAIQTLTLGIRTHPSDASPIS